MHNWVYQEMWTYYRKKHTHLSWEDLQQHWKKSHCDLLEVYCSSDSQLTAQCVQAGMSAKRFCLRDGDLATFHGRCQLYDMLWMLRTRHVWCSPRCGPWSNWNRLNSQKSLALADKIHQDRISENVHLLLCDAIFRLQDWRTGDFHFHLEQPQGSELVFQREIVNIVDNHFTNHVENFTAMPMCGQPSP